MKSGEFREIMRLRPHPNRRQVRLNVTPHPIIPETRNPKPETPNCPTLKYYSRLNVNPTPETRNPKPENPKTRKPENPKPGDHATVHGAGRPHPNRRQVRLNVTPPKPETRNPKTRNPKPETR
ncbi:hypothetical protein T484DRAFT_3641190, partial [Baffinella frigidus]